MIPKVLHFNWIGDLKKLPEHDKRTVDSFHKMNPDFEIDFFNITIEEFFDIIQTNKNLQLKQQYLNIYKECINQNRNECDDIIEHINSCQNIEEINSQTIAPWFSLKTFGVRLSDRFRFKRLNDEGGIWCDLDCIPLKPFDEKLLNNEFFRMKNPNNKTDIFFMGCIPGKLWSKNEHVIENPFTWRQLYDMVKDFKELKLTPDKAFDIMKKNNTPQNIIDDQYIVHVGVGDKFT